MSMTLEQSKAEIGRLFDAYPTFRTFLASVNDSATTAELWAKMLTGCNYADVQTVIDDMITGKTRPVSEYESKDFVVPRIRRLASLLADERYERQRVRKVRQQARDARKPSEKFGVAWRVAWRLGVECDSDEYENCPKCKPKLDELIDWQNERIDAPAWLLEMTHDG